MWQRSCPPWMLCPPWTQMWSRPHPQTWPRPLFSVDAASEGQHPPPCRSPGRARPYLQEFASSRRPEDRTMQCRSVIGERQPDNAEPDLPSRALTLLVPVPHFYRCRCVVFFAVGFLPSSSLAMNGQGNSLLKGGRAHCPVCFVNVFLPSPAESLLSSKISGFVGHGLVKGYFF